MLSPSVRGMEASDPPRLFRGSGPILSIRNAPSHQIIEHAKIALEYFNSLKMDDSQTDVEVKSRGERVTTGHRLVLSAFSRHFKTALLTVQHSPTATLDIDPNVTGVSWRILSEVIDFCYSGHCRFSAELLCAARTLQCVSLVALTEKEQYLEQQLIVDHLHAANFLDALYQMRIDRQFIDCFISQREHRSDVVSLHRLVLFSYARHLENSLRDVAVRVPQLSIVMDERATAFDLHCVVDFFYMGYVRASKKRLRSIRGTALALGVERLVAEIDVLEGSRSEEEGGQQAQFDELDMDYGAEGNAARPGSSLMHQQEAGMEEEFIGDEEMEGMIQSQYASGNDFNCSQSGSPPLQQPQQFNDVTCSSDLTADMIGSSIEEYSNMYEAFVEGPKRGNRGGTYSRRPHQLKMKGPAVIVQENEEGTDEVPAVTLTCSTPGNSHRRRRDVDSYGYKLPEYHAPSDVTVPLVVGDQQVLMERPFKCKFCNYRAKEKSAVDKHIRCMHTGETPFECPHCPQSFKVQSNLVRHIRAHTGHKPYQCRKCGVAYADKKNMDAHLYREHLKQKQMQCDYPSCASKFWREDRYLLHYTKMHGPLPIREQEGTARGVFADQ
ncbi:hypothetical protein PENTCL1PPCAC_22131 [Pristionchus entomophagus]|uniref:Uncharacterized protein n=1 Tax=Pristionchus entomophagus TaxID=358040 RepID=A0AAV5U0B6_9BILA|nr:hypothetical protein PENTCL1PPCAC_22131 [Pristionchus entomophagus]